MTYLEAKIPPPVVALGVGVLMWLASLVVPPLELPRLFRVGIALALVCTGFSLGLAGVLSFVRAKTTVNPTKPTSTSSFVSTGVYRLTRNPMYLGLLLILLGWATFLSNAVAFLFSPLFVLYINRFQIVPEERVLSSKFGAEFAEYKQRVRRWL
jgi:protein-S-isoprenylcysteine O-methyltransferase Ste14